MGKEAKKEEDSVEKLFDLDDMKDKTLFLRAGDEIRFEELEVHARKTVKNNVRQPVRILGEDMELWSTKCDSGYAYIRKPADLTPDEKTLYEQNQEKVKKMKEKSGPLAKDGVMDDPGPL